MQQPISLLRQRRIQALGVLVVLNGLIFCLTAPLESSRFIVLAGFIVMALDLWVLINAFVRLAGLIVPYVASRRRRLTWSMASFGLVILLLTSIGQLTWRDALVVLVVWSVGYFYASYLKSIRHAS